MPTPLHEIAVLTFPRLFRVVVLNQFVVSGIEVAVLASFSLLRKQVASVTDSVGELTRTQRLFEV